MLWKILSKDPHFVRNLLQCRITIKDDILAMEGAALRDATLVFLITKIVCVVKG